MDMVTAANNLPDLRQVSTACPACGSRYRRGDRCNICGAIAPVPEEPAGGEKKVKREFFKHGEFYRKEKRVRY